MNDTIQRQRQAAPVFCSTLAKWLLAALALGSLLFAHGCHGDNDHELFTRVMASVNAGKGI